LGFSEFSRRVPIKKAKQPQTWDTQVKVDISFIIGKEDASASDDAIQELKTALKKVGKDFEVG
jgi:hypothetical protein